MSSDLKYQYMIAPCGMNCGICIGHLRERKPCCGCLTDSVNKPNHCIRCSIVNCEELTKNKLDFCFACSKFPCARLKRLDKRYRTNYGMSMIENLTFIKENGLEEFQNRENDRWTCKKCSAILSVHRDECLNCKEKYK